VVKLENEIVIFEIVIGMVHGLRIPKIPSYTSSDYSSLE
jgi:hypothetical protein